MGVPNERFEEVETDSGVGSVRKGGGLGVSWGVVETEHGERAGSYTQ